MLAQLGLADLWLFVFYKLQKTNDITTGEQAGCYYRAGDKNNYYSRKIFTGNRYKVVRFCGNAQSHFVTMARNANKQKGVIEHG